MVSAGLMTVGLALTIIFMELFLVPNASATVHSVCRVKDIHSEVRVSDGKECVWVVANYPLGNGSIGQAYLHQTEITSSNVSCFLVLDFHICVWQGVGVESVCVSICMCTVFKED